MTLALAHDVYTDWQPTIQPYHPGDMTCKKTVLHYEPMLRKQGSTAAKMWLRGWERHD